MFGGRINLAQLGGNKRFLDGLISKHVIAQEAERLGLGASDAELAEKIRKQFSDASGQFVGFERYKESVSRAMATSRSLKTRFAPRSRRRNCAHL